MTDTLVVNLFGGPGVSKSTNRALVFAKLKLAGMNVEEAPEFAKELVWEGRHKALRYQQYIIGKQMWRVERLRGEVDVVVTDSPILFGLIYGEATPRRGRITSSRSSSRGGRATSICCATSRSTPTTRRGALRRRRRRSRLMRRSNACSHSRPGGPGTPRSRYVKARPHLTSIVREVKKQLGLG
jgi:hypothetical protein